MTNTLLPEASSAPTKKMAPSRRTRVLRILGLALGGAVVIASIVTFVTVTAERPVTDGGPAQVAVASVDGLGEVLVDGDGQALYLFEPDEAGDVTCTGGCAAKWPPLVVDAGADPQVVSGIDGSQVAMVADQDGRNVVTFQGWPLYRYTSDQLGEVSGSGRDQNGGTWWALSPTGERIQP